MMSRWKIGLAAVALATAIGLVEAIQAYLGASARGFRLDWSQAMGATMPSWYVLLLLLPPTCWMASRFRLDDQNWRNYLVHIIASTVFASVHLAIGSWISGYLLQPAVQMSFLQNLGRLLSIYFVVNTLFYWLLVGGYYAFDYSRRYRERERAAAELALERSRLEASLTRANLDALRMQLNPHFLFNTLNTISVLAMKGEKQSVVHMISRLSDLLRLSLENRQQTVSLGEELEILQRYLEIEEIRFRDRLTVCYDIDEQILNAEVPTLLLQPLVENAIRHGIARQRGAGRIDVGGERMNGRINLWVRDTGEGFRPEDIAAGTGVGLSNTAARLEQLYGSDQQLQRANAPDGGAIVTITIPYRQVRPSESVNAVEEIWTGSAH